MLVAVEFDSEGRSGRMERAHQGIFATVSALNKAHKALTRNWPLGRGRGVRCDGILHIR